MKRGAAPATRFAAGTLLFLAACVSTRASRTGEMIAVSRAASSAGEMIAVCRAQEAAWNRGDLEAFMAEGYWNSPELSFFSGGSDTRGYEPMLERYRARYQRGGNQMGKLTFSGLEEVPLADGAGLVRGKWKVEFEGKPAIEGLFTLAMQRRPEGWRIVHDHTSLGE